MAIKESELRELIVASFPDADVKITDLVGSGDHYQLVITDESFSGKSKLQQHKLVYAALQGKMANELHALQIKTLTK